MPYLYMHIQSGDCFCKDLYGEVYATLDDARQEALLGARDIMSDKVLRGQDPYQGHVIIADDAGRTLMVVPFRDAVRA